MRFLWLLLFAAVVSVCKSETLQMQCSTNQRQTAVGMQNANVILAGIFPIHKRKASGYGCGELDEGTMQLYEAARWSLEYINLRNLAGNGLKLGMQAWDNCHTAARAVENVLNFYPEDTSQDKFCNASDSVITMGVLGPFTSWSSEQVARLLSVYPASQISYGAADSTLSDKAMYPFFMRTAPSSGTYATNLLALLRTLQWNHLVAIFTDDAYGTNSFEEFLQITQNTEICISQAVLIDTDDTLNQIQNKLTQIVQTKASVGLIFAPSDRANVIMDALGKRGDAGNLQWILNDLTIEENNKNRYLKGALLLSPKSIQINDFVDHWVRLNPNVPPSDNPWYREWFMTKYNCRLPGNVPPKFQGLNTCFVEPESKRRANFKQNPYVEPVVLAMFAFARAMNSAHLDRCFGQQGLCQALLAMSAVEFHQKYLMKVDYNMAFAPGRKIKFDSNGDLENPEFLLWNYIHDSTIGKERLIQVGSSQNDVWKLQPLTLYDKYRNFDISATLTSKCPTSGCPTCLVYYQRPYLNYLDGDILIGGLFSAHDSGRLPFTCGPLNLQNVQAMVAFRFAIENVKKQFPAILPSVSLGAVYSDVCQSSTLVESTLSGFLGEKQVFRDRATDQLIEPNLIQAYVSSLGDKQSILASKILSQFKYPDVEASAMAAELSDREKHPYFGRTATGEDIQLTILAQVLNRKGWTYIQVVSNNQGSAEALKKHASALSVCVSAVHITDPSVPDYDKIVSGLKMNPHARAVVVIGLPEEINDLLTALQKQNASEDFVLLGTDSWGTSNRAVINQEQAADGSITLTTDVGTVNEFKKYLDQLDPKSNPLLTEWYQKLYNCYLYAGAQGAYSKTCGKSPFTSSPKFILDKSVYSTINAVYVIASALNKTIQHYCGLNNGVCAAFRASRYDTGSLVLKSIRNVTITDINNMPFVIKNGEGQANHTINNYQKNAGYIKVGTYNIADNKLQLNPASPVKSQCPGTCYECHHVTKNDYLYSRGQLTIAAILGIHSPATQDSPLLCGDQINDYQYVSALEYAIHMVNSGKAPVGLNGIQLGSLILDSCKIGTRAFGLMSAVYSGTYEVSKKFRPSEIVAWMTDTSGAASQMGLLASKLKIPLVSPAATSEALMDKSKYSTFYRTIPGDENLSATIVKLCRIMNFRYIQTIASDDQFSLESASTLKNLGKQEGVCVIANFRLGTGTKIEEVLKLARQNGAPVVLFVSYNELEALLKAKKVPEDDHLIFITPKVVAGIAKKYPNASKNLLTTQILPSVDLKAYEKYMENRRPSEASFANGFFEEFYQDAFQCDLSGRQKYGQRCPEPFQAITDSPRFTPSIVVGPTINGVYAVVDALHDTLTELCGVNFTSICPAFHASQKQPELFLKKLDQANVPRTGSQHDFRFINREGSAAYEILRFDGITYQKVGSYDGVALKMDDISKYYQGVKTNFQKQYHSCQQQTLNFTLSQGDVYIAGIFDVHNQGLRLFSCGNIKMLRGYQTLEAFQFAIEEVNKKKGQFKDILPGVTIGGVGLDSCSSDVRAGNLVSNINNGLFKLEKRGITVNPNEIFAYIGGPTSDSSIYLSRILRTLQLPQISYAATSVQLNDRDRYSFFLRTVPADDKLVEAMTNFLNQNDIRYVQVVHTANNYGIRGSEVFNRIAEEQRICVAQTISFADKGISLADSANNIVSVLLEKPLANTIVIFAQPLYINELLKAINREPLAIQRKYRFVGASQWGKTWEAVRNVEHIAENSVSMAIQNSDIYEFNEYLKVKTLANHGHNPWFGEYYEKIFNCYLTEKKGDLFRPCRSSSQSVVSAREYVQDDSVLNVINSVFATALALDQTLKQVCGANYTGVCGAFKGQQTKGSLLLDNLKKVKFMDLSSKSFEFTDRGDSNKGYIFYQLQKAQPSGYRYQQVATTNNYGVLDSNSALTSWRADCDRLGACSECAILRNPYQRFMVSPFVTSTELKPTIIAIFNIHSKGPNTFQCGKLDLQGDFINMLAFFYALDLVSQQIPIIGVALDTCGHSLQVDQDIYSILNSGSLCHDNHFAKQVTARAENVYSFLTMHNENTIAANRVLRAERIAYLSPDAAGSRLLAEKNFEYLYRTSGSQSKRIETLVKFLKDKDIQNSVAFFSPNSDHLSQLKIFMETMQREKLCVVQAVSAKDPTAVSNSLQSMSMRKGLKVILLLTTRSDAETVLDAMQRVSPSLKNQDYVLLGAEDWMSTMKDSLASRATGVVTVRPKLAIVEGFSGYVKRLRNNNRMNIPLGWFEEFYQRIHKCRLPHYALPENYKICTQLETISDDMLNLTSPVILKTILGTLALTNAIDHMTTKCKSSTNVNCQVERKEGRQTFRKILNETNFDISQKLSTNPKLNSFRFTNQIWEPEYVLQELRRLQDGSYKFQDTTPTQNFKSIDNKDIDVLTASCQNCDCVNDVKIPSLAFANRIAGTAQRSVGLISIGELTANLRNYFHYENDRRIYDWALWAIIVAGFTAVGIIVTLIIFFYLLIAYPIRGGTTPLGFIFMIGILGIYGVNFAFFVPASLVTCAARRFCMGVVYAICFACLLVKAVDNWRSSDSVYDKKKYKRLSSSLSLVLMAIAIILMQVIIPVEWLLLVRPSSVNLSPTNVDPSLILLKEHDYSWCTPVGSYDSGLALSFIFVIILDMITILFGALAWDSEKNCFESRWIVIACLCTTGCFLVWMVVSTVANPVFRDPAVAIGNFVNATTLLIIIPLRKVVLLVDAKKNEKMSPTDMIHIDDLYHRPPSYLEPGYIEKTNW